MEKLYKVYLYKSQLYNLIALVEDEELADNLMSQVEAQEKSRWGIAKKKEIAQKNREYYKTNRQRELKKAKERYKKNIDKRREYQKEYRRRKKAEEI